MRTIFRTSAENAKIEDDLADDAVCSEPLSVIDFPVRQGRYREYSQFRPVRASQMRKNSSDYEGFMS
jgi:hypothetical protein